MFSSSTEFFPGKKKKKKDVNPTLTWPQNLFQFQATDIKPH